VFDLLTADAEVGTTSLGIRRHVESAGARFLHTPPWLAVFAAAVASLTVIPLLYVGDQIREASWSHIWFLVDRPRIAYLLGNSVELTVLGTGLCIGIALSTAWCVERTDLPFRRLWRVLIPLPIAMPAVVSAYGWVSLTPRVQGLWGAVMVNAFSYYPLIYLPLAAAFRLQDPALEEVARSLGHGPWRTFLRVSFPHALPALLGGSVLVSIHLLAEYGSFTLLRFQTFTTAIYNDYRLSFDGASAAAMTLVLIFMCLCILVVDLVIRGATRYARLGSGVARRPISIPLGRWTVPTLGGLSLLVVLSIGVPIWMLGYWLTQPHTALFQTASPWTTSFTTIGLGLSAAVVGSILAFPVALLAARHTGKLVTLIERSIYVGQSLPDITVALALIFFTVRYLFAFYQTTLLLVVAYGVIALPQALVAQRAALTHAEPRLEDVSRSLGLGPLATLRRVTLPLVLPGIGAGAALVFSFTVTELTTTLLLRPTGTETLATAFWANATDLAYADAAPYALLMVLIAAPATYALTMWLGRDGRR
jgi:iron(III) transport system permease protein